MVTILLLFFIILLLIYLKLKYFTLRGPIPGLSPHLIFGNLIQSGLLLGKRPTSQVYIVLKKRFGDIYQYWLGFMHFVVVHDIDDVQYIFTHRNIYDQGQIFLERFSILFPESSKFKRHGAVTMPLFRRSKIISNINLIIDATDKFLDRWRARSSEQVHTDIIEQCQNLLLEIFGLIAFDYDLEIFDGNDSRNKNEMAKALLDIMSTFKMAIYAPIFVSVIYMKLSRQYKQAKATVERYLNKIVEQELAESPELREQRKKTSLIASLISSLQTDEADEARKKEEDRKGKVYLCLSRAEVFDDVLMLLIAGYETTSTALVWCIYHLSKHPRVQQKIKTELMENTSSQHLSLDHLDSLVYLDCFVNEVLRYSPTIDSTCRSVMADDCLPKSGTRLYKGDQILIPTSALGRDSRHWKIDPELFYPERFLNEDKNHHPYAFLPFGNGHRQCVGRDLALFEIKVILARMLQQVTFGDGGPEVNAGGFVQKLTMLPKHIGVTIDFH
ncbi:unnamed protein product [Rotaria sordida]|uniref:Cytochrome P450 n=2 Tax=Rotaria sordida TaxID=392033 RepID=A0A819FH31_9BILA|nr:unnamed protein product [Rotaria sordida]